MTGQSWPRHLPTGLSQRGPVATASLGAGGAKRLDTSQKPDGSCYSHPEREDGDPC